MTAEYLDALTAALSFDRALAQRVRKEFEDHLREAAAADPVADRAAAEARAAANCGDPRAIAAELAATALAQRTRRLALGLVLALLGVLLAMKGHIAWYSAMQWGVPDEMRPVAATIGAVTRYAFWSAIFVGAAGWAYALRHRPPSDYLPGQYAKQLRRFCVLSGAATAALVACTLGDAMLAAIRLAPIGPSPAFLVPIGSIAFEMACAAALIVFIRALLRRAAHAAGLHQISAR